VLSGWRLRRFHLRVITYFLGTEETDAYARDFLSRLDRFEKFPTVWCPITHSGVELLKILVAIIAKEFPAMPKIRVLSIELDNGNKNIRFVGGRPKDVLKGESILLLDGAIHSGSMMSACAEKVLSYGPSELSSYALVVKRGSAFIPTLWGLLISETDRAFFSLKRIPNNRLNAAAHDDGQKRQPLVHLERLSEAMLKSRRVVTKVASMDRMKWSDRHFQMLASDYHTCTYVLRCGKRIIGYLTMHALGDGSLMIDEVAIDNSQQGRHYGGVLMRFADTLSRQGDCPAVRLLAIENNVPFYQKFEYRLVEAQEAIVLDNERYHLMEKVVLFHRSPLR